MGFEAEPLRFKRQGAPPPANGSWNAGSRFRSKISRARGWSAFAAQARRQLCQISARARSSTSSLVVFSQRTRASMSPEQAVPLQLHRHVTECLPVGLFTRYCGCRRDGRLR